MQDLIRKRPGVLSTRVGYAGGDVPNATYRNHGTHAEAIEIAFDPEQTSYRELLEFFFQIHDPTTLNRQGNDRGMSYRSAIFYVDEEQRRVAEDTVADVEASGLWPGNVVTEVTPAGPFWEAEPEHQDYLERYPNGYTCHFPRPDWVLPAPDPKRRLNERRRGRPVTLRGQVSFVARRFRPDPVSPGLSFAAQRFRPDPGRCVPPGPLRPTSRGRTGAPAPGPKRRPNERRGGRVCNASGSGLIRCATLQT